MALSASATLAADFAGIGSILSTVSIVITALAALVLVLCGFIGWRRGLFRSLLRFAAVILAAVSALALTFALKGTVSNLLSPLVSSLLDNALPADLLEASPSLEVLLTELPGALSAPILFGLLFTVCNFVFWIVYLIVKRIKAFDKTLIPAKIGGKVKVDSLVACATGLVGALVLIVCFTIPLSGYLNLADNTLTQIQSVEGLDEELTATLDSVDNEIVSPLSRNAVVVTANALGGKALLNSTSAIKVNGGRVVWEKEISYLFDSYVTLKPIIDTGFDFTKFGEEQAASLRAFAGGFDQSVLIPAVASEILPAAATAWSENRAFAGIENPVSGVPAILAPMMETTLDILKSTTIDTLKGDLVTVSEVLATMSESGAFAALSGDATAGDLLNILSQPGLISGLIDTLYENERMQVLVSDVANMGFNAVGEALNIPADDEAVYNNLVVELNDEILKTQSIEGYDEKIVALSSGIENVFGKYGVATTTDEATLYAECIIGIGPNYNAPAEEAVPGYFQTISGALNDAGVAAKSASLPLGAASTTTDSAKTVADIVKAYKDKMGNDALPQTLNVASQISGQTTLEHSAITMQSLGVTKDSIANMSKEDFTKQSKALESVLVTLVDVVKTDENNNLTIDITKLDTEALSSSLRDLAETRTDSEGNEMQNLATAATNLIKSALQTTGINADAANNLVEHVITQPTEDTSTGEEKPKDTLGSALSVVTVLQNETVSKEKFKQSVGNLILSLDKASATVLADCVSPNLINKYTTSKLPVVRVNAVTASIKAILSSFGEHSDDLSEEQLDAETAYMQTIFELALSADNAQGSTLFGEDGASKLGMTAAEFVSSIAKSVILSETIVEQSGNLKVAINNTMAAADKAALSEALSADTTLSSELKNALDSIFALSETAA